ncbi:MAG: hypothetical protein DLM61_04015 [Pseudonocardiales bacterium]|nr:hypothetical protein [Pseudonocardiales bacterium]PZS34140.1 MAG: hypothetical protein DLM61_04015 [Pseudonocardiales bacterium]
MALHVARRGWILLGLVIVVLSGAVGVGMVLRDLVPAAAPNGIASSGGSIGTRAAPKGPEPGPATVVLAEDAAVHPDADRIRKVLQKYFDAINAGDYPLWRSAVIPQWARDIGESAWHGQYRSTLDGTIVVHRLEARPGGGLVALASFTSLQNPADAPPEVQVRCLRWWVSYPLIGEGDQLRMGPTAPSANLRAPC